MLEEFRQIQVRIAEEEKGFAQRNPDYYESVRKLERNGSTPIPPNSYCHLMMNVANAVDVGYHLSRHPEAIAKLWSLESSGRINDAFNEMNRISRDVFQGNTAQAGVGSAAQRERPRNPPPAPITPVRGGYVSTPDLRDPNLDYQTYKRMMNERERGRR